MGGIDSHKDVAPRRQLDRAREPQRLLEGSLIDAGCLGMKVDRDFAITRRDKAPASARLARRERLAVFVRHVCAFALWGVLAVVLALNPAPGAAQELGHFGKNRVLFAPVEASELPDATGTGIVDYKGGEEPESQWRATFRFTGLEAGASYTVVVRGRTGEGDSDEAAVLSPLCSFTADRQGKGNCFWYFRGLARLNVVQLRSGDENGPRILQATRSGELGSITTDPNRFSPGGENPVRRQEQAARKSR